MSAAERTLNSMVWGLLLNNSTIYDGTALFTAGHSNLLALAYSYDNVKTLRLQMTRQKDLDDAEAGRMAPRTLAVGPGLIEQAWEDVGAAGKARLSETGEIGTAGMGDRSITHDNPSNPNSLRARYGLDVVEVHEFDEVTDADDNYYLCADPNVVDMIEVGFLDGKEDPEIVIQNLSRVGSFFDEDEITWKVRHVHDGGTVLDFRPFQGGIAP